MFRWNNSEINSCHTSSMADPFSILASAISVVGAALKTAEVTRDFIQGIRDAPQTVASLTNEVSALRDVLKTLQGLLSSRESARNTVLVRMIPRIQQPLNQCMKALDDVDRALRPYVKTVERGSRWRTYSASVMLKFREKDILSLQRNLANSQSVLDSAVQVVHL